MKCALIIPAWSPGDIFPARTAGSQLNYWQPLGLLYVGAALIKAGHEVRFYDGAFLSRAEIIDRIRAWRPGFAGIHSTTFGWREAACTVRAIKDMNAAIFTCVGGPYPIAVQEHCLEDAGESLDAVVTGEGEETAVELVQRLESGQTLDGLQGIVFRRGAEVISNPPRPLKEDLDALPFPARELLGDRSRYLPAPATYRRKPVAVLLTSRGCSRRCIYCSQIDRKRQAGVHGVRFRSVENVMAEITACLAEGYREIKFIDDSFAADYDRALDICREIRARGLDFTWFASACANQVDAVLLKAMKAAGCWAILIGAESGVQRNLNTLRKGITLDQIRGAVKAAKKAGLRVSTPFLFGIPGQTYADALASIDFAIELAPDLANFHALTPFPGTPLYERLQDYGSVSGDLTDYTFQGAAFVPHTLTREQIHDLRQIAFARFYARPSFLVKRLLAIRTVNDCRVALQGARSLFGLWRDRALFRGKRQAPPAPMSEAAGGGDTP